MGVEKERGRDVTHKYETGLEKLFKHKRSSLFRVQQKKVLSDYHPLEYVVEVKR
jgi:hypothetical protein